MSDQLMSKQHSWPFPCIKPKFEGHSLPDEVMRLVALFALPTHPLKEAFSEGAYGDGGAGIVWLERRCFVRSGTRLDGRYQGMNEEDPDDSFIANWFGTNVLVNLQFIFLFLFFLSNEGY